MHGTWRLKCFVHHATLHEAKPGHYFLLCTVDRLLFDNQERKCLLPWTDIFLGRKISSRRLIALFSKSFNRDLILFIHPIECRCELIIKNVAISHLATRFYSTYPSSIKSEMIKLIWLKIFVALMHPMHP